MATALVVGASRGIGLELARQYRAEGWQVLATARNAEGLERLRALGAKAIELDVTGEDAAATLHAEIASTRFDVAILNAGVYGPHTRDLDPPATAEFDRVLHTNVLAAMRLGPLVAPRAAPGRFAVLSSRMGAIGERSANFGWLYRASKAALNSVLKDIALEFGPRGAICVALHPGWVRTDMGGAGASIAVTESVADLRRLLAGLTPAANGGFYNHDGSRIGW